MGKQVPRDLSILRSATFQTLWIGDLGARLGYQVSIFMLPLIVVTVLNGSGTRVGLISAAQFVPIIALSLVVGAWTSQLPLRGILVVSNVVRGAAFLILGALYAWNGLQYWELLLVAVMIGSVTVFYDIGFQVSTPRFFSGTQLVSANGFLQATASVTQMAGPAVAGYLAQKVGITPAAIVTAGLLGAAAIAFSALGPSSFMPKPGRGVLATIRTGLSFTWKCRPIRDLCTQSSLFNLHEQAFFTIFLIFGVRSLGLSSGLVGALIGLGSVGALVGSLVAGRAGSRLHLGLTLTISIFVAAVGLLLVPTFALAGDLVVLVGIGFIVNGAALAIYNVLAITLRQEIPPDELLGSVTASYRIAAFGMMPVGSLIGGVLADEAGPQNALWIVSISLTLVSLLLFISPLRSARDVVQAQQIAALAGLKGRFKKV